MITLRERAALETLARNEPLLSAKELGVPYRLLRVLRQKGWVTDTPSGRGRRLWFSITEQGEAALSAREQREDCNVRATRYVVFDPRQQELVVEGDSQQLIDCFGDIDGAEDPLEPIEAEWLAYCAGRQFWLYKQVMGDKT